MPIITTRYALLRTDNVWIEAGDTADDAASLARVIGGRVMECRMCEGGAKWVPVYAAVLARRADAYGSRGLAASVRAGR